MESETIVVTRAYTYDETQVLGKSAEENALRQSLARDLALRVLRRIAADRQSIKTRESDSVLKSQGEKIPATF